VINLENETTVSLSQVARRLPPGRRGRPVTISCILRWILDGVRLPSGEVVRLEAVRLGGRWLTTLEAVARFADRQTPKLTDAAAPVPSGAALRAPARRQRESERAADELTRIGI
jgi:hypothetical protein